MAHGKSLTIRREGKNWVFDDPSLGLEGEPFSLGADVVIERLAAGARVEDPETGFGAWLSTREAPTSAIRLRRMGPDRGGFWYRFEPSGVEGWLPPTLLAGLDEADTLYLGVERR